jgi:hypothetical protein
LVLWGGWGWGLLVETEETLTVIDAIDGSQSVEFIRINQVDDLLCEGVGIGVVLDGQI